MTPWLSLSSSSTSAFRDAPARTPPELLSPLSPHTPLSAALSDGYFSLPFANSPVGTHPSPSSSSYPTTPLSEAPGTPRTPRTPKTPGTPSSPGPVRRRNKEGVPRPPNPFILYRSDQLKALKETIDYGCQRQADVSRLIGFMWRDETPEVRQKYELMAEVAKFEHSIQYPDYRYKPFHNRAASKKAEGAEAEQAIAAGPAGEGMSKRKGKGKEKEHGEDQDLVAMLQQALSSEMVASGSSASYASTDSSESPQAPSSSAGPSQSYGMSVEEWLELERLCATASTTHDRSGGENENQGTQSGEGKETDNGKETAFEQASDDQQHDILV